jgi:2-dehydro-3-deoxygluconokinase
MTEPRFDVTTFGETMLRLSVPAGERVQDTDTLRVHVGGAESNVASALARLGRRSAWLGSLPDTMLGQRAANELRQAGVNLDGVVWNANARMGLYVVEFAAPPRPIQVTYDRAHSAAAQMTRAQVNWEMLLDTRALHLTGITPPLSQNCLDLVQEATARAHAAHVPVSFDINYRAKLWTTEHAARVLRELIQHVTLLFCSRADAQRVFGWNGAPEELAQQLFAASHAQCVTLTLGAEGVLAYDGKNTMRASAVPTHILDRLGAGDALAAGVLHGWLNGDLAQGLRYGTMMAALALSQHGDMVMTNAQELEQLTQSENTLLR